MRGEQHGRRSRSVSRCTSSWNSRRAIGSKPAVGSSRNSSSGRPDDADRDVEPPPLPAGQLPDPLVRLRGEPDHVEQVVDRPRPADPRRRVVGVVRAQVVQQLADPPPRHVVHAIKHVVGMLCLIAAMLTPMESTLLPEVWIPLAHAHAERADEMTADHRARRATGAKHAIDDFLYDYYGTRPTVLRRWHPGVGTGLAPSPDGPAPHAGWRWYRTDRDRVVIARPRVVPAGPRRGVRHIHGLLTATASRPAFSGCFGLHEWAMVYRQPETPAPAAAAPGPARHRQVVEQHPIRCTHFDAFRFFTPRAVGLTACSPPGPRRSIWTSPAACTPRWTFTNGRPSWARPCPARWRWTASPWPREIRAAGHAGFAVRPGVLRPAAGEDRDAGGQGGVRGPPARIRRAGRPPYAPA